MKESHFRRLALAALVSGAGLSLLAPRAAFGAKYTLNELLALARKQNPGIRAGAAATDGKGEGSRADVELNGRRAYWGLKLARELRAMLEDGEGYLDTAQKKVEKELADGSGSATVTDRLRLRTVRTEIEVRLLEAKRTEAVAKSGLRALLGPGAPADLDVDDEDFEPLQVRDRQVS